MILLVLTDSDPIATLKRLLSRVGFVLVPLSILFIRYYPRVGRGYSSWTGEAYNIGVATDKNGLGIICLVFGLGSVWCVLEVFRGRERVHRVGPLIAHGMVLALTLWLAQLAKSATSFSCLVIGGGVLAIIGLHTAARKVAMANLLVGTVLLVILYGVLLNPEAGLIETVGRDSTLTGRTRIWSTVVSMTVNPLFGAGYESFWLGERLQKIWEREGTKGANQAHNGYLEVYLDLGYVGLALLAVVMVWGYRDIVRALRRNPEAARIRLAFFVVATVYNLSEHAFRELHPVWIAFLLAVTVVPKFGVGRTHEVQSIVIGRRQKKLGAFECD